MKELTAHVQVGERYVCLDGAILHVDAKNLNYEGWVAKHRFACVPQVAALKDSSIVAEVLASQEYWKSNALNDR